MKLHIDTNWDPALIDALSGLPVVELCAGLPHSAIGTSRPVRGLQFPTDEEVAVHLRAAHDAGLKFTFVLDAPGMEGHEFEPGTHAEIVQLLSRLSGLGADGIELGFTYVAETAVEQFPELEVRAAESFRIHAVDQAHLVADLGVASIAIDQWINRDFPLLSSMREELKLPLIVNASAAALRQDPHHGNLSLANSSGSLSSPRLEDDVFGLIAETYYFGYQVLLGVNSPESLLMAGFIRPEDLAVYERIGLDHFRLDTAGLSTGEIVELLKAYAGYRFDGNLAGMIPFFRCPIHGSTLRFVDLLEDQELAGLLRGLLDPVLIQSLVQVDNRKLNGFIEKFDARTCPPSCNDCDWCADWAKRALKVNPEAANRYRKLFERFSLILEEGRHLL